MNQDDDKNKDIKKNNDDHISEYSVNEAAEYLNVNPRSIINYIKAKQFKAIKVGKAWFIDKQSLKKFGEKFGFNRDPDLGDDPDEIYKASPLYKLMQQQQQLQTDVKKQEITQSQTQEQTQLQTRSQTSSHADLKSTSSSGPNAHSASNAVRFSVLKLRLFQLAVGVFSLPRWQEISKKTNRDEIENSLLRLKNDSLQLIGSGFYSFSPLKKCALYSASRERIGAMLALFYAYSDRFYNEWQKEITVIENDLLPAYSSLIKKLDNPNKINRPK